MNNWVFNVYFCYSIGGMNYLNQTTTIPSEHLKNNLLIIYYIFLKVHLTPKYFFWLKLIDILCWVFLRHQIFSVESSIFYMPFWNTEIHNKNAIILFHDWLSRGMGLLAWVVKPRTQRSAHCTFHLFTKER